MILRRGRCEWRRLAWRARGVAVAVLMGCSGEDITGPGVGAGFLYVSAFDTDLLYVIDLDVLRGGTGRVTSVAAAAVGTGPWDVAVSPDGRYVYSADRTANAVSVVETGTNRVVATVPVGVEPVALAMSPDGRFVYVANYESTDVSVIETSMFRHLGNVFDRKPTNRVLRTVSLPSVGAMAVTPDGAEVWVVAPDEDAVMVVAADGESILASIPVGQQPQRVAMAPDDDLAYVTNLRSPSISVVDRQAREVVREIALDPGGGGPYDVAVTPDGRSLLVTRSTYPGVVNRIDLREPDVVQRLEVGPFPHEVGVAPDGSFAVVTGMAGHVSVIDLDTGEVVIREIGLSRLGGFAFTPGL